MAKFDKELGAFWKKTSNQGTPFYAGKLKMGGQEIQFVAFKNSFKKEGSNEPDFRIFESEPIKKPAAPQPEPTPEPGLPEIQMEDMPGPDDTPF